MTIGVGGISQTQALAALTDMSQGMKDISKDEYLQRINKAQLYMQQHGIDAIYLNAGTNLRYFTGTQWFSSERMVGAILPARSALEYIAPIFEIGSLQGYMVITGKVNAWQEDQSPYQLLVDRLAELEIGTTQQNAVVGICESAPFFISNGIAKCAKNINFINASEVTAYCRSRKSSNEIALMQRVKDMTLRVQQAAASILYEGITTAEVEAFIELAHQKVGASGSYFVIVLFGEDSAFPHGVKHPQALKANAVVLIDTGCKLHGYISDITRTYVFGEANQRQRQIWSNEKDAQLAAFAAAQLGASCKQVDQAARQSLLSNGLSGHYDLPGLPHRTGHGIGLDIHEWPYLVASDDTLLDVGMCFSNEPMICVPNEFGIRLEDHFYMTSQGPKWFTQPSHSIDDPFGLDLG